MHFEVAEGCELSVSQIIERFPSHVHFQFHIISHYERFCIATGQCPIRFWTQQLFESLRRVFNKSEWVQEREAGYGADCWKLKGNFLNHCLRRPGWRKSRAELSLQNAGAWLLRPTGRKKTQWSCECSDNQDSWKLDVLVAFFFIEATKVTSSI